MKPVCISRFRKDLATVSKELHRLKGLPDEALLRDPDQVNASMARLETLLKRCSDRDYLDRVKMKLRKLAKRKAWRKRRPANREKREAQICARRERLHQDIDRWQRAERERDREVTQAQARAKERRQQKGKAAPVKDEAQHLARLVDALTRLRQLRRKRLEAKGHFFPEEGNTFFDQVKASVAQDEEQVEHKSDETRETAPQTYVHPEDHWQSMDLDKAAYAHWTQAYQDVESLRRARTQWDCFLSRDGTRIPPTWVPPAPPASAAWAAYLHP